MKGRRDRAILELLYGTGLRMSECARLELTDVDLSTGTLFVRDGKGRKDRIVPLAGQARDALGLYLARSRPELARWSDEPALFLARTGKRLSTMSLRVLVREYGRRVRVKASCHVLRHSYATHLLPGWGERAGDPEAPGTPPPHHDRALHEGRHPRPGGYAPPLPPAGEGLE